MEKEKEYKRIYCCGDCVQYKRHKCVLGAKDEGTGREHFYRDCPLPTYIEKGGIITNENTNNDLIRRNALKEEYALFMWREHNPYDTVKVCDIVNQTLDFIDNAANGDAQKEDLGKWIIHDRKNLKYGCNQCGNLANIKSRFCPNCGKRMNLTGAHDVKE